MFVDSNLSAGWNFSYFLLYKLKCFFEKTKINKKRPGNSGIKNVFYFIFSKHSQRTLKTAKGFLNMIILFSKSIFYLVSKFF